MPMTWKKRINKGLSVLGCLCSILLISSCLLYFAMAFYYRNGFSYGTWINGIYCTGKTIEEVNEELKAVTRIEDFRIVDKDGEESVLVLGNLALEYDYTGHLEKYLNKQNPFLWINNITAKQEKEMSPEISFDKEELEQAIFSCNAIAKEELRTQDIKIQKGNEGYELYNGMTQVLNRTAAAALIEEAIAEGKNSVDLASAGCYSDLELTPVMEETLRLWEKVEAFQSGEILYDMGDSFVKVGASVTSNWITLDETGGFLLDAAGELSFRKEGVREFISVLAKEYDTYGGDRVFHSTRGDLIKLSGGIYGNKIDQEAEVKYLIEAFLQKKEETHIPQYTKSALVRGKNDIGDTYIEIDMAEQKLYYYLKGELKLETEIVTGDTSRKWGTPDGVNYVYAKQKNRILRGPGYASPVKYWMPVNGGIGIHDASWRSEFGGEIYVKNGSHGCINLPPKVTPDLFNSVELGTPVVMFY